ncbi:MAG TPA: Gfo/Idh/MocA family oxidoreductase [Thermoanaerobaculia bacterium]|nr:Gfo/Idh/MocA family oxidoreductase [Thermoanaerobaculia bacterium]
MTPGERPVRLAVIGVGHLGRHHARVAASLPGVEVAGVLDHHNGRAEDVAREFGLKTLADLAAVASVAEAAVVATPTVSHAEIASELLEKGVDVLVEKPMTASLEEADGLVALARAKGRILAVGHIERHNPAVEAAMTLAPSPVFVEVDRLGSFTRRSLDVDVVLDLMIHDLQIVQSLARRPVEEIRAAGLAVLTPLVDIANARIAFQGGCVANLTASRVSARKVRKLRVFAPSLYLSVDMQARAVSAFRLSRGGSEPEIAFEQVAVAPEEPLARELADFAASVRSRRPPLVDGAAGRAALALAIDVLRAIELHRLSAGGVPA